MLLTAILAFVAIAGIGFVVVGGGGQSKISKRAQAITERQRTDIVRPHKAGRHATPRRKQIVEGLKEQERQQKKATLTLSSKLQQAGLGITVKTFWIIRVVIGAVGLLLALV